MTPDFAARYGPVAIVTGAAQGIGACYVHELARRGLDVVAVDLQTGALVETCDTVRRAGTKVSPITLDLAAPDHAKRLDRATAEFDVGLVIHNAAWSKIGPFASSSFEELQRSLDVNVRAPVMVARTFAPRLSRRDRSGMIFMSSLASVVGAPRLATYAASRAYTRALGESLWSELSPAGVDVLVAMPGATSTTGFWATNPSPEQTARIPLADPKAVALEALDALGDGPVRVLGRKNRLTELALTRLLPRRLANRFVRDNLERMYG